MSRYNLKAGLMHLGNQLVTQHGFEPRGEGPRGTGAIVAFTEWLNSSVEARALLRIQGIDWPVVGDAPAEAETITRSRKDGVDYITARVQQRERVYEIVGAVGSYLKGVPEDADNDGPTLPVLIGRQHLSATEAERFSELLTKHNGIA